MITVVKKKALTIFIHSLLSGLYQDNEFGVSSDIKDFDSKIKRLESSLKILIESLEEQKNTLDDLLKLKITDGKVQAKYYYSLAIKNLNRFVKEDEKIIDKLIALSICSYLIEEKNFGIIIEASPSELIGIYEEMARASDDKVIKDTIKRCLKIGTLIVDSIDKANYKAYERKIRKNLKNSNNNKKKK